MDDSPCMFHRMSITTPNDIYYKSRRFSVVSSALLLLAVYVGLSPTETDSGSTIFQLKLKNPDYLPTIFLLVSFYSVWQFWASWYVQTQEIRNSAVNKADCLLTGMVAISAIVSFFHRFSTYQFWLYSLLFLLIWFLVFIPVAQRLNFEALKIRRKKDADLNSILVERTWNLLFNPQLKKSKQITFLDNGDIGDGRNNNETTWRIREGLLELLNKDGKVFSRFRYNKEENRFDHTNDDDTISIRHQEITSIEK